MKQWGLIRSWFQAHSWLWGWLVLPMAMLSAFVLYNAQFFDGYTHELLVNLGFLFLGVLLTVLYVDTAVAKHEEARWKPFQGAADEHIRRVSAQFAHRVEQSWNRHGPGPFMVPAWKEKNETRLWHIDLCRDKDWLRHVREVAAGPAQRIQYQDFKGQHQGFIDLLADLHREMERSLIMYGRILTPLQQATAAHLIQEIPNEIWLLRATQNPEPLHSPANLGTTLLHTLTLVEDVNSRRDPNDVVLPWDSRDHYSESGAA